MRGPLPSKRRSQLRLRRPRARSARTIINQPVIERVIETQRVVAAAGGLTEDVLNARLQALDNELSSKIYAITAISSPPASGGFQNQIAITQRIDKLQGTDITGASIANSTITGSSVAATTLSASGLTSLATTAVTGDLTVNGAVSIGTTATSGLTTTYLNATYGTTTNSTSTNLYSSSLTAGNATSTNLYATNANFATSSATGLTWVNATGTNATTTFFSSVASSTNLFAQSAAVGTFTAGTATVTSATTTNFFATNASTTNATSTNLFSVLSNFTTAIITTLTASIANITGLTATNATTTNATTTNAFATNLVATNSTTTNSTSTNSYSSSLIAGNATSTNFFATNASSTNSTSNYATSTNLFASFAHFTTGIIDTLYLNARDLTGLIVTNSTTTNATTTNAFATNAFATNFIATSATTTNATTTNLYVSGATTLGASSANTFIVNAALASNLVPDSNKTRDLGSASFYFRNGYIDSLNVNNISAASTTIGGTASNDFTINSDNGTADTESMNLIFFRGTVVPNALLTWNSAANAKHFEFNQSLHIANASASTTNPTLTLKGVAGQSANILQLASSTGTTIASVDANGLGTFANILANGSSTLQNFTFVNATGTAATTTNLFSTTASSTNLFSTNATFGTANFGTLALTTALPVSSGGTGAVTFGQGWVYSNGGTGALAASTSPTVAYLVATSSTASILPYASTTAISGSISQFTTASSTNLTVSSVPSAILLTNAAGTAGAYGGTTCTNQFVRSLNGAGAATCATVSLTSDVTGTLAVGNGGTGWANIQAGGIVYGNGSGAIATTSQGSAGQVLAWLGGIPSWTATTTFSSGLAYSGGNVTNTGLLSLTQNGGGSAQTGALTFATSSQTTNGDTVGLNITNSGGTFTFNPTISGTRTVAGGGTGISSYTPGDITYANSASTLARVASSTDGFVLTLQNGAPSWVATTTLSTITGTLAIASAGNQRDLADEQRCRIL